MAWNLNVLNYVREYVKKLQVDTHIIIAYNKPPVSNRYQIWASNSNAMNNRS